MVTFGRWLSDGRNAEKRKRSRAKGGGKEEELSRDGEKGGSKTGLPECCQLQVGLGRFVEVRLWDF